MGLKGSDDVDDGDGKSYLSISCSICLDAVNDDGKRSWAKLLCGHQFHLDCIGSAFNIKGAMQCPNCRKIEKGQWLYANSSRPYSEFNMDDWTHDEDLYDLSYSEMSFGVGLHWCPFNGLTRIPSSFDDGEFPSTTYHDLLGQHAIYAEHTSLSSAAHPCPYVAYFGPIHPSSSNSGGNVPESSNYSSQWNGGPSIPSELQASYAYPALDLHYHNWEQHYSTPFSSTINRVVPGSDHPQILSARPRSGRGNLDNSRSGAMMPPFINGHGSSARAGASAASSMAPPYPGSNARARDRIQALQAYYQQQPRSSPPMIPPSSRRPSHRNMTQLPPAAPPPSDQTNGGFYFFPPSTTSGQTFPERENPPATTRFLPWEIEHLPPSPPYWGTFHQPSGGSDSGGRPSGFRQRHGSERTTPPSQNWP